jgi:hypothetical protein
MKNGSKSLKFGVESCISEHGDERIDVASYFASTHFHKLITLFKYTGTILAIPSIFARRSGTIHLSNVILIILFHY